MSIRWDGSERRRGERRLNRDYGEATPARRIEERRGRQAAETGRLLRQKRLEQFTAPDPDPLTVGWETYVHEPDDSGAVLVYAVGAILIVLAALLVAYLVGWRP